jgi:hypothetical protein
VIVPLRIAALLCLILALANNTITYVPWTPWYVPLAGTLIALCCAAGLGMLAWKAKAQDSRDAARARRMALILLLIGPALFVVLWLFA